MSRREYIFIQHRHKGQLFWEYEDVVCPPALAIKIGGRCYPLGRAFIYITLSVFNKNVVISV